MKILQITEASSGGVGRHVLDLSAGLMECGCEVHLLHGARRMDDLFRCTLEKLPNLHRQQIDLRRNPHPSDWLALRRIKHYIREHGPFHIIHGQSSKGGAIARMLNQDKHGARVYTPHCIITMSPKLDRLRFHTYRLVERTFAHWTDALITVSPDEKRHLLELGFDAERIYCIPNGIAWETSTKRDVVRSTLGLRPEQILIGFLGRFTSQKNPRLLINAFAQIAERQPAAMLAMVGWGEMEPELRGLATKHGLQNRIIWPGFQPAEKILPAFDIFALSSSYEAMPYVLLEALAAGLPIVATRVGGTELTVESDHNGLLVEDFLPGSFAATLETLLNDADLRRRMGEASYHKAKAFQITTMIHETHDVYRRVLKMPTPAFTPVRS